MAITFTDVTVCAGGNHVTLHMDDDGVPRTVTIDAAHIAHDLSVPELVKALGAQADQNMEPVYRALGAVRAAGAANFHAKRAAILSAQPSALERSVKP